jgi:ABC-type bacteriocin/lantibiotic exporter with double-glycine peptidase domain
MIIIIIMIIIIVIIIIIMIITIALTVVVLTIIALLIIVTLITAMALFHHYNNPFNSNNTRQVESRYGTPCITLLEGQSMVGL